MRLRDIPETSAPIPMQEQDIQNKVNSKRSRFGGLEELATDQIVYIWCEEVYIYYIAKVTSALERLILMGKG